MCVGVTACLRLLMYPMMLGKAVFFLLCCLLYFDELLDELSVSGVGCYWGSLFASAFAYADDIVLY